MRLTQPQKSSRDQLSEVLEFFNVVVREEDIFSRCLVSHSLPHCLKHAYCLPSQNNMFLMDCLVLSSATSTITPS